MKLWKHLLRTLEEGQKAYLLTVVANFGSSPGRKGFKMMVTDDGFIYGSIGGGVMEHSLVEEVKELLSKNSQSIILKKQIHKGKIKDGSGMICSGEQTVVFHPLNVSHIPLIKSILLALVSNAEGTLLVSSTSLSFVTGKMKAQFEYVFNSQTDWSFKEQMGFKNHLYIVGGGHVSLAVSDLLSKAGFYVTVFDNRQDLNTLEMNTSAHQKLTIDYNDIEKYIAVGNQTFITIMTNTYIDDKLVLSNLLKNQYRYIGVLGSKAKLKTMWEVLLTEGFEQEELDFVDAPIGIPIKSQTPEEIAISIGAKIIKVKNKDA